MELATFGAGCFWGVESAFSQIPGVIDTKVGFEGGALPNPTYRDVCTDKTGHAEVVQVTFDPAIVSYQSLLDTFFDLHDPTQLNRQGPDYGTQYRSVVFYHNPDQAAAAKATIAKLTADGRVVRRGKSVGFVECEVTDEQGRLVAKASSTYMTLRGEQASGR